MSKWNLKPDKTNVKQDVINLTTVFNFALDKQTMRPMTKIKIRLTDQSQITNGILAAIKTTNRLYKKYFKNKNDNTDNSKQELYRKIFKQISPL